MSNKKVLEEVFWIMENDRPTYDHLFNSTKNYNQSFESHLKKIIFHYRAMTRPEK